jgi:hypothetical protein
LRFKDIHEDNNSTAFAENADTWDNFHAEHQFGFRHVPIQCIIVWRLPQQF